MVAVLSGTGDSNSRYSVRLLSVVARLGGGGQLLGSRGGTMENENDRFAVEDEGEPGVCNNAYDKVDDDDDNINDWVAVSSSIIGESGGSGVTVGVSREEQEEEGETLLAEREWTGYHWSTDSPNSTETQHVSNAEQLGS